MRDTLGRRRAYPTGPEPASPTTRGRGFVSNVNSRLRLPLLSVHVSVTAGIMEHELD
jgi:hypothetical protein